MEQLNFPPGAMAGTSYVASNGVTYIYDGFKWIGRDSSITAAYSLTNNGFSLTVLDTGNITIPNGKQILYESGQPVMIGSDGTVNLINNITQVTEPGNAIINGTTAAVANSSKINLNFNKDVYFWSILGDFLLNDSYDFSQSTAGSVFDRTGNLYVYGFIRKASDNSVDMMIAKYDTNGDLEWQKIWKDDRNLVDPFLTNSVLALDYSNAINFLAGDLNNNITYIGALKGDGTFAKQKTFTMFGTAYDMVFDPANNVYITGNLADPSRPYYVPFVVKLDQNYNIVWQKAVDIPQTSGFGNGAAITIDEDQNIYVIGWYVDPAAGVNNAFLMKMASMGNIVWQKTISIPVMATNEVGWSIQYKNQSIYTLVRDGSFSGGTVVSKFDLDGNQQWQKILNIKSIGTSLDDSADISLDDDGYLYVSGSGFISNIQSLWLTKIDVDDGSVLWQRQISAGSINIMLSPRSFAGHRQSDIYKDKISISGFTDFLGTVTTSTGVLNNVLVLQVPIDGSLTGSYDGINYNDVTGLLASSVTTGTYTNVVSNFSLFTTTSVVVDSGSLVLFDSLSPSNYVVTRTMGSTGTSWVFNSTGTIVFPNGTTQVTAWDGRAVTMLENSPAVALTGTLWFDPNGGRLYVYYDGAWIDTSPAMPQIDLGAVNQDIIPSQNLTYNLGSTSSQWRSLYVGTSTIYIGGQALSITSDGSLTINNNPISTLSYSPTTPTDWVGNAPTTVTEALDRLAALVKSLNNGTGA